MRHQNSVSGDRAARPCSYVSTVEVETTGKIIIRVAGILVLGSLLLGILLPSESPRTLHDAGWLSLAAIAGTLLIFLGPRALHTTVKVSTNEVTLFTTGFRTRLNMASIESVTNSNFPSGGYGYRYLGKGHRGFISGGPQVDIKLKDGMEYTVSVASVEEFSLAVAAAKAVS